MDVLSSGNAPASGRKSHKSAFDLVLRWIADFRYVFLVSMLVSCVVAFLVNTFTKPTYLVKTSVLIKERKTTRNNPENLLYGESEEAAPDNYNMPEEIALLRSYPLIYRTLDSLDMHIAYFAEDKLGKTELYKDAPFRLVFPDRGAYKKISNREYGVTIIDGRQFRLEEGAKGTFGFQDTVNLEGCPLVLETTPYFNPSDHKGQTFRFSVADLNNLVWDFKSKLNIRTNASEGSIIDIYLETDVPQTGIDFLNGFTRQYLNYKYEEKSRAVSQSLAFINNQLDLVGRSLGGTESNLVQFKTANAYSDASKMSDRSMSELSVLDKERASLLVNEKYYQSLLGSLQRSEAPDRLVPPSSVGIPDGATDGMIQQLTALQLERNNYASAGGAKNPLLHDLDVQINTIKTTLQGNIKSLLNSNRTKINQINASSSQHQSVVNSLPKAERKFVDIKRENDLNEQIYLFLSQKKVEAGILRAATTVENKVIESAALESSVPLKPNKRNNYALALLAGIGLPFGYIWLRRLVKKQVLDKDDLQGLTSMPVVATIYHAHAQTPVAITPESRTPVSESFRVLRSYLVSLEGRNKPKAILVTSLDNGAGKSFCSLNMAYSLAFVKKKVILVNFDLRLTSPVYKGLERSLGLSSFLDDLASVTDIIAPTDNRFLDYIAAGEWPVNSSELLTNEKLELFIDSLKQSYDYVIIDSPPLGIVADSFLLAKHADCSLVVVRANHTGKEKIVELEELQQNGALRNIGLVLNGERLSPKNAENGYYVQKEERGRHRKAGARLFGWF